MVSLKPKNKTSISPLPCLQILPAQEVLTSLSQLNLQLTNNLAGSTGNICTVRCRNNALAGPFGGCFAVQQVDTTAAQNSASTVSTAQTLEGIQARKYSRSWEA